jgi:hypothetical protein
MRRLFVATLLACSLFACPKSTGNTTLGGSTDEQMDAIGAQIEEYSTQPQTECGQLCTLKAKVCNLSGMACSIAGQHADRADYQRRCVATQEECARYNESCSNCK